MNQKLNPKTHFLNSLVISKQVHTLSLISKWLDNTPAAVHLNDKQWLKLVAKIYGFKNFNDFQSHLDGEDELAIYLPAIQDEQDIIVARIQKYLVKKFPLQTENLLFAKIIANYLKLLTNNKLPLHRIHCPQSAFLHHYITHYPDAALWGESPFLLAFWMNKVGHLGTGEVLSPSYEKKIAYFYRQHLQSRQSIFGKLVRYTKLKCYELPILTPSKTCNQMSLINFKAEIGKFKVDSTIGFHPYERAAIQLLTELPLKNTLRPCRDGRKWQEPLEAFKDPEFVRNAQISNIVVESDFLNELAHQGIYQADIQKFGFDQAKKRDSVDTLLKFNENIKLKIYGELNGFSFIQSVHLKLGLSQNIGNSEKPHVYQAASDASILDTIWENKLPIQIGIKVKHKGEVIAKKTLSDSVLPVDFKKTKTYAFFIKNYFIALNGFIFSNRYPLRLAYDYLYLKSLGATLPVELGKEKISKTKRKSSPPVSAAHLLDDALLQVPCTPVLEEIEATHLLDAPDFDSDQDLEIVNVPLPDNSEPLSHPDEPPALPLSVEESLAEIIAAASSQTEDIKQLVKTTVEPVIDIKQTEDELKFIQAQPTLPTNPNFKLTSFCKTTKRTSKKRKSDLRSRFFSRNKLFFIPFDSTKPSQLLPSPTASQLIAALCQRILSHDFHPMTYRCSQSLLDNLSELINYHLYIKNIKITNMHDLTKGRYWFSAPPKPSKAFSAPRNHVYTETELEYGLTRSQKAQIFDVIPLDRLELKEQRFNLFAECYLFGCFDETAKLVDIYSLKEDHIAAFTKSLCQAVEYFGAFNKSAYSAKSMLILNNWLNHHIKVGNIKLPTHLEGGQCVSYSFLEKSKFLKIWEKQRKKHAEIPSSPH